MIKRLRILAIVCFVVGVIMIITGFYIEKKIEKYNCMNLPFSEVNKESCYKFWREYE